MVQLFNSHDLLSTFFDGAYQYSFQIFEYIRSEQTVHQLSTHLPYLLSYSVGGIHSMLLKWVENDMVVSSKELIEILRYSYKSTI